MESAGGESSLIQLYLCPLTPNNRSQVLNFTRFSSKSDVWAYGVLCWEVFTCGEMPYGRAKNPEVVERVQRGQILQQPPNCPNSVYEEVSQLSL